MDTIPNPMLGMPLTPLLLHHFSRTLRPMMALVTAMHLRIPSLTGERIRTRFAHVLHDLTRLQGMS